MDDQVRLRPLVDEDGDFLQRLCIDPDAVGPFLWSGFSDPRARLRRWERDGYIGTDTAAVAVVANDGTIAGIGSWEVKARGGPPGGCYEIGLALLPKFRGRGLGTQAHRLLVRYLFNHTLAQRLEAQTDADNVAERRSLERVGFRCEGLLRQARFRQGDWRDIAVYGLLRCEADLS